MSKELELLPECPFFGKLVGRQIICEGVDEHSLLTLNFRRDRFLKHHRESYCCSMNYGNCPLAQMHYKRYGCEP